MTALGLGFFMVYGTHGRKRRPFPVTIVSGFQCLDLLSAIQGPSSVWHQIEVFGVGLVGSFI